MHRLWRSLALGEAVAGAHRAACGFTLEPHAHATCSPAGVVSEQVSDVLVQACCAAALRGFAAGKGSTLPRAQRGGCGEGAEDSARGQGVRLPCEGRRP